MAIGAGAAGAWAAVNATTQTVTLPSHASGDLLIAIVACKAALIGNVDITTATSGWARLAQLKDGAVNSGNGTGSVCQSIFFKRATSGSETNPVFAFATTSTPGIAVAQSFTKAGGEVWLQPVVVQKATNSSTSISVTMDSNPGITSGDWGIVTHTTRDDSALTVPTWTATGATLAAVVEYPASAIASGTSDDMAGDAAYRSVTSGTASAAPVCTGTQAAAETGVTGFIRLRVATASAQTVTPTTASLTLTTFAPSVLVPNNVTVTPTTASLSDTQFAPTVLTPRLVTPTTASNTTATFAPTVRLPKLATPTTANLSTSTFAPTVTATAAVTVTPTTASLTASTFAPTASAPRLVTPPTVAATLATFAPTVTASDHKVATPSTSSLTTARFAPGVFAGQTATPTTANLSTSTFAPTVTATVNVRAVPSPASLSLATFVPAVAAPRLVTPITRAVATATFAPDVIVSTPGQALVVTSPATLTLTTYRPAPRIAFRGIRASITTEPIGVTIGSGNGIGAAGGFTDDIGGSISSGGIRATIDG